MNKFKVLSGMPCYGEYPEQFSSTGQGAHNEGYVVEFFPDTEDKWVGNFQPGLSSLNKVIEHPNQEEVIIISGGEAYIVCPSTRKLINTFGGQLVFHEYVEALSCDVFANPTNIEVIHKDGKSWKTKRISWDGMRKIKIVDTLLFGEAYTPMGDKWMPFKVNLLDGSHEGGSYK